MKKQALLRFLPAAVLFLLFAVYTVIVALVGVRAIGPNGSEVGLAAINGPFRDLVGVNWELYTVTDILGLVPLALLAAFAVQGLVQLFRRRSLLRVDHDLLLLGGYYLLVLAFYLLFEVVEINARPFLIEGVLETSYPSSTTMLAMATLPAVAMHLTKKLSGRTARIVLYADAGLLTAIMVGGRILAGVHWLTDIIGGALLSLALLATYYAAQKTLAAGKRTGDRGDGIG